MTGLKIANTRSNKVEKTVKSDSFGNISACQVSRDERYLVACGLFNHILVFDLWNSYHLHKFAIARSVYSLNCYDGFILLGYSAKSFGVHTVQGLEDFTFDEVKDNTG